MMLGNKILIIDADFVSRNFVAHNLEEQKYDVLQADSGKQGLIFAWRDHPDIVIIDPALADIAGEELAAKLRQDPRTAHIPLIALSDDSNSVHIKSCFEAGFNEYIIKSEQAVSILNETLSRLLGHTNAPIRQGGLLMVFLSAKGGTGTSSLCANIAMNISQNKPKARLVVVDLVLPIGSIAPIVGYGGAQNIVTITDMSPEKTTPGFFQHELPEMKLWRFNLLAGSPDPESSNHLNVGRIWDIVNALKVSYDYVLVDIGRALSKITLPLIQNADLVALIISTDTSTVSLTKTLLDYFKNKGVNFNSIHAILNRAAGMEGLSKADAEKELGNKIMTTFPYLGSNLAFANSRHRPFSLEFPKNTATIIFQDAARDMEALARKSRGL